MLNQISIMGRLTKDPELRYTSNNTPVAAFTIACDRDVSSNGEKQTDFFNCVAWRATGEFVSKYFTRGALISLIGRLQMRSYESRDGERRQTVEIVVDKAYFCGEKKKEDVPAKKPKFIDVDDDEQLPF